MTTTPTPTPAPRDSLKADLNHSLDRLATILTEMEGHPCECLVRLARPHFANVREIVDQLELFGPR